MRSIRSHFPTAIALLAVFTTSGVAQVSSGRPAPSFELPRLSGSGYLASDELFSTHQQTLLIFWDSDCPHCVESLLECDIFYAERGSDDIAMVGIHADQGNISDVFQLIEANGISFPQLWDLGGETGQNYDITLASFTLFLVDRNGSIIAQRSDPEGNMRAVLDGILAELESKTRRSAPSGISARRETPPPMHHGFVFHGQQRIRFLGIDARGSGAAGPYGEEVQPGNNLLYRFEFEMSKRINRHLRVGGLLRISNEGEDVLESGPQYFASEWGSAFAEVTADRFQFRIGYYDMYMTPLTLMRWDWNDNPRIGGDAGCGCGAAAGVLLVESLEELNPELIFEGGMATYRISGLEAKVFYAIPRRANKTTYLEVRSTGVDRADFSLEIFGFESLWRRFDSRTNLSYELGVHFTGSRENPRSVDFDALGYPATDPWYDAMVISADWFIPLVRFIGLEGEWLLWNRARGHGIFNEDDPLTTRGKGGVAGIVFDKEPGWNVRCDYIRLDDEFYSPFAALSYAPNREGFRVSADVPIAGEALVASVFYKSLREMDTIEPGANKEETSFVGVSIDAELSNGLGGSLGWLDNSIWRRGSSEPPVEQYDVVRKALVVGARYSFDKNSSLQLQYQRIDGSRKRGGLEDDALTNLFSVYLSARF
jgi:hypothetical protein